MKHFANNLCQGKTINFWGQESCGPQPNHVATNKTQNESNRKPCYLPKYPGEGGWLGGCRGVMPVSYVSLAAVGRGPFVRCHCWETNNVFFFPALGVIPWYSVYYCAFLFPFAPVFTKKKRVNNENPISFSTFWKTSWKKELRLLVETLVQSHCGAVLQFIAVGIRQKIIDRVQFVSPSQEPISSDPTKCWGYEWIIFWEESTLKKHLWKSSQQSHAITLSCNLHQFISIYSTWCNMPEQKWCTFLHFSTRSFPEIYKTIRNHPTSPGSSLQVSQVAVKWSPALLSVWHPPPLQAPSPGSSP